jgi:hypothetical protein
MLQVHDAIYTQCKVEDALRVSAMMEEAMKIPLTYNGKTFIIPSDCKIGYNWGVRKDDNPLGMVDSEKWRPDAATQTGQLA